MHREIIRKQSESPARLQAFFQTCLRTVFLASVPVIMLSLSACSGSGMGAASSNASLNDDIPAPAASPVVLTIGTADTGGSMYPAGNAIAKALENNDSNLKINVSASSGSVTNVTDLVKNRFDMALVSGDTAYDAFQDLPPFSGKDTKDIRVLGAVYSSMSNWIAPKSSGITFVHDLKDQIIANGPASSSTDRNGRIVLETLGIDSDNRILNTGFGDTLSRLSKSEVTAVHGFAGIPIASLTETAEKMDIRLLMFRHDELQKILSRNPAYHLTTIPAGTYRGQTDAIATFGIKCLLCVSASMDDETAEKITQTLIRSSGDLSKTIPVLGELSSPEFLCTDLPIPLHPGAKKAYREAGLLK